MSADFELIYLNVPATDRSSFEDLTTLVGQKVRDIAASTAPGRRIYLAGESMGGVMALSAMRDPQVSRCLDGLVLINPATSLPRAWPTQLPPLLQALSQLPDAVGATAYQALAMPILSVTAGSPLRFAATRDDQSLPEPLRPAIALSRLATGAQIMELLQLTETLPLRTLEFRLRELLKGAESIDDNFLKSLRLPVQLIASSDDRILPSVDECRRLRRLLPNAQLSVLEDSGHCPLLEGSVSLAKLVPPAKLEQAALRRKKDFVSDFSFPSIGAVRNASESLQLVRRLTSPVFLSTDAHGRRVYGLGGLPPLPGERAVDIKGASSASTFSSNAADAAFAPLLHNGDAPPVLFVGNHQLYGFLDLPLLVEEVLQRKGTLIRGLAHPVAFQSTSEEHNSARERSGRNGGFSVDFEKFGAVPVSPRALLRVLKRNESALLYPGGVREAFKSLKDGEKYKLFWPSASKSSDFVPLAAKAGATIVPVAAIGAEEGFNMLLDADEMLELPYFGERLRESAKSTPVGRPGERFVVPLSVPQLPERFYFLFGAQISTAGVDASDAEACVAVYEAVRRELESCIDFLLSKRQQDPYRALLPRAAVEASWNWTRQAPSFTL